MVLRLFRHIVLIIFAKDLKTGQSNTFKQPFKAQNPISFDLFLV